MIQEVKGMVYKNSKEMRQKLGMTAKIIPQVKVKVTLRELIVYLIFMAVINYATFSQYSQGGAATLLQDIGHTWTSP